MTIKVVLASMITLAVCMVALAAPAQYDFLILDADHARNSGPVILSTLSSIGCVGEYATTLTPYVGSLPDYCSVWICLGTFPNSAYPWGEHNDWNDSLVSYLENHAGNIYMEGGDCWSIDPPFSLRDRFNIEGYGSGPHLMGPITGVPGTFAEGISFGYGVDTVFMDCIRPIVPAYAALIDSTQICTCGVANEPGPYKTLGVPFELGSLAGGPSSKSELVEAIMTFFGCMPAQPDYDISVIQIMTPDWYSVPGIPVAPQVRFKNVGLNDSDTFDAYVEISPGGYTSHRTMSIPSGGEVTQEFDLWNPGAVGEEYVVCSYHTWLLDLKPQNDTICKLVTSWDGRWEMSSSWTLNGSFVTVDGYIDPSSEWADATVKDVSDLFGRSRSMEPAGSAYLYTMNDSLNLYIALDAVADPSMTSQDAWSLYLEDNFDRSWPDWPDSSEGQTNIDVSILPMHEYQPLFSDTMVTGYRVSLSAQYGESSGHMQYEYIMPCSRDPARGDSIHPNLLAGPGDTIGFWMAAADEGAGEIFAWWPTSSFLPGQYISQHGMLILSDGVVGREEAETRALYNDFFIEQNVPNPFRHSSLITYSLPLPGRVSLHVFDITGRLVETLVNEAQPSGFHQVHWKRKSNPGGVYFYTLRTGGFTETKKMVAVE